MQTWVPMLLGNTLMAGVLAIAAIIVMRLRRPALAHALWLLALIKLITPPIWEMGIPLPRWEPEVTLEVVRALPTLDAPPMPTRERAVPSPGTPGEGAGEGIAGKVVPLRSSRNPHPPPLPEYRARVTKWELPSVSTVLGMIWITGSVLWLVVLAIRIFRFTRFTRTTTAAPPEIQQRANLLARALDIPASPPVELIPASISPMLWHDIRSTRLLVPEQLLRTLDPEQRDALLLHELAHLKRKDHLTRFLEIVVTAIFWWHPLVWIARRGLREAEEQCCDAWVIWAMPDSARRYADALVDTLDFLAASPLSLPPGASGLGGLHQLQRRLTMIFTHTPPRTMSWTGRIAVVALLGLLPLGLAWGQRQSNAVEQSDPVSAPATAPAIKTAAPEELATVEQHFSMFIRALDVMELDMGRFPTAGYGLGALLRAPPNWPDWGGPYLTDLPNDPWGNAYEYAPMVPSVVEPIRYSLTSSGPDGRRRTADDIRYRAPTPFPDGPNSHPLFPEDMYVLTEISQTPAGFAAHLKDIFSGQQRVLHGWGKVADGDVTEVRADGIWYRRGESYGNNREPIFVKVGMNLQGKPLESVPWYRPQAIGAAGPPVRVDVPVQGPALSPRRFANGGRGGGGPLPASVLTGIVRNTDGFTAIIEAGRGGRYVVRVGEKIAGGEIARISQDEIAFLPEGATEPVRIRVGGNLPAAAQPLAATSAIEERMRNRNLQEGRVAAEPRDVTIEQPRVEVAAASPVEADQLANLSIEERLRIRRAQELNGQPVPVAQGGRGGRGGRGRGGPIVLPDLNANEDQRAIDEQMQLQRQFAQPTQRAPVPVEPAAALQTPAPPVEATFVLTGIVNQEGNFNAYVEDVLRGGLKQMKIGDAIAGGSIVDIQVEGMRFQPEGTVPPVWVRVGSNLAGEPVGSVAAYRRALNPAAAPMTAGGGARGGRGRPTSPPTTQAVLDALIGVLRDRDATVRQATARGLGNMGPAAQGAMAELIRLLNDTDAGVRAAAAEAMGQIQGGNARTLRNEVTPRYDTERAGTDRMQPRATEVNPSAQ